MVSYANPQCIRPVSIMLANFFRIVGTGKHKTLFQHILSIIGKIYCTLIVHIFSESLSVLNIWENKVMH